MRRNDDDEQDGRQNIGNLNLSDGKNSQRLGTGEPANLEVSRPTFISEQARLRD